MEGLHFPKSTRRRGNGDGLLKVEGMTAVSDFMPSTANNVAFERRPAMMTACGTIATIGLAFGVP
jgi:hypothetical protein